MGATNIHNTVASTDLIAIFQDLIGQSAILLLSQWEKL
jgi:hypothetical protein